MPRRARSGRARRLATNVFPSPVFISAMSPSWRTIAAHHLDVEEALVGLADARLADGGEGLEEEVVELLAVLEPLPELGGLRAQLVVRERLELGLERRDVRGLLGEPLQAPALAEAQDLLEAAELRASSIQGSGSGLERVDRATCPASAARERRRPDSQASRRRRRARTARRGARAPGSTPKVGRPSTVERALSVAGRSARAPRRRSSGKLGDLDRARADRPGRRRAGRPRRDTGRTARVSSASASAARRSPGRRRPRRAASPSGSATNVDRVASRPGRLGGDDRVPLAACRGIAVDGRLQRGSSRAGSARSASASTSRTPCRARCVAARRRSPGHRYCGSISP